MKLPLLFLSTKFWYFCPLLSGSYIIYYYMNHINNFYWDTAYERLKLTNFISIIYISLMIGPNYNIDEKRNVMVTFSITHFSTHSNLIEGRCWSVLKECVKKYDSKRSFDENINRKIWQVSQNRLSLWVTRSSESTYESRKLDFTIF